MYGEDSNTPSGSEEENAVEPPAVDKEATQRRFQELRDLYFNSRSCSKNEYDFFNLVERSILGMEEDETPQG